MTAVAALLGRFLIALLFLISGVGKLMNPAAADAMIQNVGLPAGLAMPTGVFEVVAAVAIILGFMTRLFAILLAGFVLLTVLFFHHDFTTREGTTAALLHLALAGGLLCLFAISQMRWSYDSMRLRRRGELATRDAEARAHDAELRAARAEGRVDAGGATVLPIDRNAMERPSAARPLVLTPAFLQLILHRVPPLLY